MPSVSHCSLENESALLDEVRLNAMAMELVEAASKADHHSIYEQPLKRTPK